MVDESDDGRAHRDAEQLTYDVGSDERPSEALVRAVASFTNTPVLELEPLYHTVDPDHLDGTLSSSGDEFGSDGPAFSVRYSGCSVTVTSERVEVEEAPDAD